MPLSHSTLILAYIFMKLSHAVGLQITRVDVDAPIIAGEGGWLRCDWDEEEDSIYAVKWYWGTHEFYRWTPKLENPMLVFEVDEFNVDLSKSIKGHVYIDEVKLKAAGVLRCEVSGEGPTFHTDFQEDKLIVVDLPDTKPRITGSMSVYELHRDVVLTCTSPQSKPAATLSFYINGEKADPSLLIRHKPQVDPATHLETAVLGIRFPLRPRLLQKGKAVVKCIAALQDLYWDSSEQKIMVDVPLRASRMEERASSTTHASTSSSLVSPGFGVGSLVILFPALQLRRFL